MPAAAEKNSRISAAARPRKDAHEVITERIVEALREGVAPWRCSWSRDGFRVPCNATTGKDYRGINFFMLLASGYGSPQWLTFKQAQAAGGSVRKGEKATPGVRWVEWDRPLSGDEVAARMASGREVKRDAKGRTVARTVGPRLFFVFNVLQTEGVEFAEPSAPTWSPVERAEEIAAGYCGGPQVVDGGDSAQYRPGPDVVYLPERGRFSGGGDYYHAAFHELVHSTGHVSRLSRPDLAGAGEDAYSREELVAEIGAAMLCAHAGLPVPVEESAAYIGGWLARLQNDHTLIVPAAQAAQKAVDLILGIGAEQ